MTLRGLGATRRADRRHRRHRAAARPLHGATSTKAGRRASTASSGRSSGSSTAPAGSIPSASSAGTSTRSRCSRSASSAFFLLYVIQRVQSGLPFNPTDMANVQPALSFNTAVSFVTNTNWQSYAGETHDEPPHPDGGPHGAAVRVGGRRHGGDGRADPRARPAPGSARSATSGSTSIRTTFRILLPLAFVFAIVLLATGVIQNTHGFTDGAHGRRRDAEDPRRPEREHGVDQAARHERRRLLQRQLRAPVLEPDRAQRLPRALRDPDHPVRARVHVRADGQGQAPGLRGVRDHVRASGWRSAWSRSSPRSAATRSSTPAGVTQTVTATSPGGNVEGKEVRFGPTASGAVVRVDDRHVERLGQLDARQLHAARRHDVPGAHEARRDQPRRCRRRPERPARLGDPGGVHRRAHGRANTGVPRQEDPGRRGEAGRDLHPGDAGDRAHRHRDLDVRADRCRTSRSSTRARTASPSCIYAFTSAGNNNGSAFAGLTANTALHEHARSPSRCCSAASS